ncbi:MAG: hypothetical protein LQ343_007977 [Gyalolechia ehrenbergii]|nr:MAG: hypothetical protein LQ343_007977 [Gyalolechia ehrenbergii]
MVIHRPGKNVKQVAKLDLGASQNLMSRRLALSLGLHLDDYLGPVLQPIGPAFRPMNRVTFDWHISGKKNVYTSVFTLLDDEKSTEKIFENDLGQGRQKLLLYNQFVIGTPPPKKKSAFEQISKSISVPFKMRWNLNPSVLQPLLGIFWFHSPSDSPNLTAMDVPDGVDIELFPTDVSVETQFPIHAEVDDCLPINTITTSIVKELGLVCKPCEESETQGADYQTCNIIGKVDLLWHKRSIAKQYLATFYVIGSKTKKVTFGRNALPNREGDNESGLFPLGLGQQTPAEQAQQAQRKAEAEKRRAEEQKQQEDRDREKRLAQKPA